LENQGSGAGYMQKNKYIYITIILFLIIFSTLIYLYSYNSQEYKDDHQHKVIKLLPTYKTHTISVGTSEKLWDEKEIGYGYIDVNLWGLKGFERDFNGSLELKIDEQGILELNSNLILDQIRLREWNVVAYPEIIYGMKPWSDNTKRNMSSHLVLPMKISELKQIHVLIDYLVYNSSTSINMAFDIWILRSDELRQPREGDVELMIWLYRSGAETPRPAGEKIGIYTTDLMYNGKILKTNFYIWVSRNIGNGWSYIAYVIENPIRGGEVVLNLNNFMRDAIRILGLDPANYYLYSIELGFELFYNAHINVNAFISKYWLIIDSQNLEELKNLSIYSNKLVAWITPWGYKVDPKEFNKNFTPGVVVAYDAECGLCSTSLIEWFNISLILVKDFLNDKEKAVFINLFSEKYYPIWTWRGHLNKITINEDILKNLKIVIGKGQNIFIGFSELSNCINDQGCTKDLVEAYERIRREFPLARLYYYGSWGEDPDKIIKLKDLLNLSLIGIDIWSYEYENNRIYINKEIVYKLKKLIESIPNENLFIGEIGLRLDDKEAYIEPWNLNRPISYNEKIDEIYYSQIFEQLINLRLESIFLGIWSWNDGSYAIMKDKNVQDVITYYAEKLKIIKIMRQSLNTAFISATTTTSVNIFAKEVSSESFITYGRKASWSQTEISSETIPIIIFSTMLLLIIFFYLKKR
jgi:hypothetical protein